MLIKLPSSINNLNQVIELINDLNSGELESNISQAFFEANPRISHEPQAIRIVIEYLQAIVSKPVELNIDFAQTPDEEFIDELAVWARSNIRENILLNIKLDPMLTGGMVIRTTKRIYDYSWANLLSGKRSLLTRLVNHAH